VKGLYVLLLHALNLLEQTLGSADTIRMLEAAIDGLRAHDVPRPPQTRPH
jgi:hypothetical protein